MINDVISDYFNKMEKNIDQAPPICKNGKVIKMAGSLIEAVGVNLAIGDQCYLLINNDHTIQAEVIGFSDQTTYLMPYEDVQGITPGALVKPARNLHRILMSDKLLGRVIDAMGRPLDAKGAIEDNDDAFKPVKQINPLSRKRIQEPLDVGVRAINSLLSIGKGQRMGIFAGSGIGKSVLIGMMTKFTSAEVVVVGLVGERGREVKEFIEEILGIEGLNKTVVIASPADESALMRVHGAVTATAIAEYFRDKGKDVLLIIDSLTRYAQANREISMALGELPTSKGYSPTVFSKLSKLVERSGNHDENGGSITAFYTVLIEKEDEVDIVGEHAKSILDGHIVLSSQLANQGHYPAIDIERSISRVMPSIIAQPYLMLVNMFKKIYATYRENKDLIVMGAYKLGSDPDVDLAIKTHHLFEQFLCQSYTESISFESSVRALIKLMEEVNQLRGAAS